MVGKVDMMETMDMLYMVDKVDMVEKVDIPDTLDRLSQQANSLLEKMILSWQTMSTRHGFQVGRHGMNGGQSGHDEKDGYAGNVVLFFSLAFLKDEYFLNLLKFGR